MSGAGFEEIARRGLVMLGCGKMGGAMLEGWLARDLPPGAVTVIDPGGPPLPEGVHLNTGLPDDPAVALIAVKPQMMDTALPTLEPLRAGPLYVSVAAGTSIARLEGAFPGARIVRAMPNTPAAIGRGITALVGNAAASDADLDLAETLLIAIGEVVRLKDEAQIDAVTGLSGSGPAYVFHMIECLAEAGEAEGLDPALAMQLARATVAGAGALAMQANETPERLRINVTSPNGTTQAGLDVLMDDDTGLPPLIRRTVAAAAARSRALKG